MNKGSMGQRVHSIVTAFITGVILLFGFAHLAHAQSYLCQSGQGVSYWSNQPCYTMPVGYPSQYPYYTGGYYLGGYQYQYPAPSCSISYSYTANSGYWNGGVYRDAIQLRWSSNYATSAYIAGIGAVSVAGTQVVYPYGPTNYRMIVYGPGGSSECFVNYQPTRYYQNWTPNYWGQVGYNYGYYYGY